MDVIGKNGNASNDKTEFQWKDTTLDLKNVLTLLGTSSKIKSEQTKIRRSANIK